MPGKNIQAESLIQLAVTENTFPESDAKEKQIHECLHSLFIALCNFYLISFFLSFNWKAKFIPKSNGAMRDGACRLDFSLQSELSHMNDAVF